MPEELIASLSGVAAGGEPSPAVRALVEGVLRSRFWDKFKPALAVAVLGLLVVCGTAVARRGHDSASTPPQNKPEEKEAGPGWKLSRAYLAKKLGKPAALALSPDGTNLAVASADTTVSLWDVAREKEVATVVRKLPETVRALAFSPDGKRVAVGSGEKVRVYEGSRLKALHQQAQGGSSRSERKVRAVTFSPDGKAVAALVCDPLTEAEARAAKGNLPSHAIFWREGSAQWAHVAVMGNVHAMAFSADSKSVVVGGKAYDVLKGRGGASLATRPVIGKGRMRPLSDDDHDHVALCVSPDDRALATAGPDHKVRLYDPDGNLRKTLAGHADEVRVITFAPGGDVVASGDDRRIILWDAKTGKELARLDGGKAELKVLRFTHGGRKLYGVDGMGVVQVWVKQ